MNLTQEEIDFVNNNLNDMSFLKMAEILNENRPEIEHLLKNDIIEFFIYTFNRDIYYEKFGKPWVDNKILSLNQEDSIFYEIKDGVKIEKSIDDIKISLKQQLKNRFLAVKNSLVATTSSGIRIGSTTEDLILFTTGEKINAPYIKDADNKLHEATPELYDEIISAIELRGLEILEIKWSQENIIDSLSTFDELIEYYRNIDNIPWNN